MNALNIKLYNLIKNNLHFPDDKAEEFKSLVKEDFSILDGEMRKLEGEIRKLDSKIDLKVSDLRCEIKESKVDTIKWMIGVFLALALMIMGLYIKK